MVQFCCCCHVITEASSYELTHSVFNIFAFVLNTLRKVAIVVRFLFLEIPHLERKCNMNEP